MIGFSPSPEAPRGQASWAADRLERSHGGIDMVSRRDVRGIEAEIGRTFEQMIPFNRVLGLKKA